MQSRSVLSAVALTAAILVAGLPDHARAASASKIDREATAAMNDLLANNESARVLAENAKAILIFPEIVKAGFLIGGQGGNGVLREGGKSVGYYRSYAASYGLQAGAQKFGYVLMFMDGESRSYLDRSEGWELGVGPSIVVVDEGFAQSHTTTTLRKGVYAFIFDQRGLMAGLGLQGSKISRIEPGK